MYMPEVFGWNPDEKEGEEGKENNNPDTSEGREVKKDADVSVDDYATGADNEYAENSSAGTELPGLDAKRAASAGNGAGSRKGLGINARSGGMGLGARRIKLSTSHGARAREAGEYGAEAKNKDPQGEKEDKNKAPIRRLLEKFGFDPKDFRLEVAKNDKAKHFLRIPKTGRAGFSETDTLENLLASLQKFLEEASEEMRGSKK
jgi:hypothetical protein